MKLVPQRKLFTEESTVGELSVDGQFECFTLEDVVRSDGVKIPGETAIPAGSYSVDITHSPKFNRDLPLLINVSKFTGIRIHPGNRASDTDGCILVGQTQGDNMIGKSQAAFGVLFDKLRAAKDSGDTITIRVVNQGSPVV